MAKKCAICGKAGQFGHNVSHAKNRTQRMWQPNLQKVKIILEGKPQKVYVCTRCLRSKKLQKV